MWEIWAAGNNAWGQLDLGRPDRTATIEGGHGNAEPEDYWTFRHVLGPAGIEALTLRAGEFRTHGMSYSFIFFRDCWAVVRDCGFWRRGGERFCDVGERTLVVRS